MDYTIDDLKGKYVKVGTHEAEIFLDACEELGILWYEGQQAKDFKPSLKVVRVCGVDGTLKQSGYADGEPFTTKPQWSIYTNDKPLCELSDEQAAALFNAWRGNSEQLEGWDDTEWFGLRSSHHIIKNGIYRIKQKSECELFVEKCGEVTHDGINTHLFEQLFNAGCRFTEGNNK